MSASDRLCCKSRFALVIKNSKGRRCGFRVEMRGTSSPHVKFTGDFGNAIEAIRIGDCSSVHVFAKNSWPCNFRLLQHNRPTTDIGQQLLLQSRAASLGFCGRCSVFRILTQADTLSQFGDDCPDYQSVVNLSYAALHDNRPIADG